MKRKLGFIVIIFATAILFGSCLSLLGMSTGGTIVVTNTSGFFDMISVYNDEGTEIESFRVPSNGKIECSIRNNGSYKLEGFFLKRTVIVHLYFGNTEEVNYPW